MKSVFITLVVTLVLAACARVQPPKTLEELIRPYELVDQAIREGDCEKAVELLREAVRTDSDGGRIILGNYYEAGYCDAPNYEEAFRIYEELALAGEEDAKIRLGFLYLKGLGITKDEALARKWFESAALRMAPYHDFADDFLIDTSKYPEKPEEFWRELNEAKGLFHSEPKVRYQIARKLREGDGVPKDIEGANRWLRSAAADGLEEAKFDEAVIELDSVDYTDDSSPWYTLKRLAKGGFAPAMLELSMRHPKRRSDIHKKAAPYYWLLRARNAGMDVEDRINALEPTLTKEDHSWVKYWFKRDSTPLY